MIDKKKPLQKAQLGIDKENIKGQGGGVNVLAKDSKSIGAVNHTGFAREHAVFDAFMILEYNKLRTGVQKRGNRNIHTERGDTCLSLY